MKAKPSSLGSQEIVLLALLALVPVVFSRVTQDCFEFPQAALLATGSLFLLWRGLASELAHVARPGPGGYPLAVWNRLLSFAGRDPIGVGVLLFLASSVASTLASPNPAQSLHGAPDSTAGLVTACSTAFVYFAARSVSRGNPAVLVRFARAAGFASAVASGYALIQLAGLDPLVWGRTSTYEGEVRIFSTLGHPNMLGAYLAMAVPLTVWLATRARGSGERVLWALIATASAIVIAATLSRGAWIALVAGAVAWAALGILARGQPRGSGGGARGTGPSRRVPAAVLASLLAIAAAGLFFARTPMGSHLVERVRQIASLSAPTTQSRLEIWRAGLRMVRDHPWLGVGLDAFGTAFPRYRTAAYWRIEWARTPNKAHNEALGILATQGFVGGAAALIVVVLAALAIVRAARRPEEPVRAGAVAVGAALVAFVVQDLASFTVVSIGSLAAALLGWAASTAGAPERREAGARPRRTGAPAWALALAGAPAVALFFLLVVQPFRAQIVEKVALRARAGSPERALALEDAAKLAPWDARYPGFLGSSLLLQAREEPTPARARETLRRAAAALRLSIAIEPENGYTYSNLARVATAQAQLHPPDATAEDARRGFAQAMERDPQNAEILDQAANAMMQVGQMEEGRSISRRAAALYPNLAQPMALLGYAALLDRRWADAADTLELAAKREWWGEKTANANAWSNLSAAYLALHRNEDALRAAEAAIELDPSDADSRTNRDLALERLGRSPSPPGGAARPGGLP
jgi:O-antigen ligase/tetratricopeptide (TPR) repeat protein